MFACNGASSYVGIPCRGEGSGFSCRLEKLRRLCLKKLQAKPSWPRCRNLLGFEKLCCKILKCCTSTSYDGILSQVQAAGQVQNSGNRYPFSIEDDQAGVLLGHIYLNKGFCSSRHSKSMAKYSSWKETDNAQHVGRRLEAPAREDQRG